MKTIMAELTSNYVGKPFCECNCMQLLYDMYSDMGIDVPNSFDGLNLSNYLIQWEIDKKSTIKKMIELFNTLGNEVEIKKLKKFDLLVIKEKNNIYPAMYLGLDKAITSNLKLGVRVFFIGEAHQVMFARRLV